MSRHAVAIVVGGLAACAQGLPAEPPGPADARRAADAARAAAPDAPVVDAAVADAAIVDATVADARGAIDAHVAIDAHGTPDAPATTDAGGVAAVIFADDQTSLYRIDPVTYGATLVGAFGWPAQVGSDAMADIAVAPDGSIIGASSTRLYRCDATSAACTLIGGLAHGVNALAFVPKGVIDPGNETLVGAMADGSLYRIDATSGAMTSIGHYSSGHASSGDLAYAGGALFAAVNPGGTNDSMARVDPASGATTMVGTTGRPWVWGLATAGGTLVGFTLGRDIVTIDPATGATTKVGTGPTDWYGAAGR